MRTIFILNGPNLNLLGQREPEIYGRTTLDEIRGWCEADAADLGLAVDFRQSNFEGEIIEAIHAARTHAAGIVINPAGYTFTSVAILDALKMFAGPKIELHISNVHQREAIYHKSLVSPVVTAVMAGFGAQGYRLALRAMAEMTA
ncbi:type II 3-dehydroquinate dehydratase [Rhizobiaceae bacterium BDR2-2]|uniref:3-dehydroquinate dehydratase n=1 Tax=Ectorhizobium quercum TaxID=2965071 RepID=A0AAE3N1E6_9HYPH|nr:type II 3-dehydroquinate dehydratase [Ectorhizobium quercum]MCX8998172.1 type II 3-dehydroquinate dehydratase [Ectorhizobium quercum]